MRGARPARGLLASALILAAGLALTGCGDDETEQAEKAVESLTGDNDVELKGNSELDAAGYALVAAQGDKYSDYEVDGTTVRLFVADGAELSGAECVIVTAATETDYPDATFVVVADGEETVC